MESNSSVMLQILNNYMDYFRTLEPENALVAIQAIQHLILSIPSENLAWYEKEYLKYYVDLLITYSLNEKDRTLVKRVKVLLVEIGKKFRTAIEG